MDSLVSAVKDLALLARRISRGETTPTRITPTPTPYIRTRTLPHHAYRNVPGTVLRYNPLSLTLRLSWSLRLCLLLLLLCQLHLAHPHPLLHLYFPLALLL